MSEAAVGEVTQRRRPGMRPGGKVNVCHPGRECIECGGPIPDDKKDGTKYCGVSCRTKAAKRNYRGDPADKMDACIDTFGFLRRKGLANSGIGREEMEG